MTAPVQAPAPLTAEQLAFAAALFRKQAQLRCSGVKHAIVTLTNHTEPWRVAPVGRRVEIR